MTGSKEEETAKFYRRMELSFEKFGWTPDQQESFRKFVNERIANYRNPIKTLFNYLDVLNKVAERIKKPFNDIEFEELVPILQEWENFSIATSHGFKSKLKSFLRWASKDKHYEVAQKIRTGSYVSPITNEDLLTDEEIRKLRNVAKQNPRDLAILDLHLLWGLRPAESIAVTIRCLEVVRDRYIIINVPQRKTTGRPIPIPLAQASLIQDPKFLDASLNTYVSLMSWLNIHPGYPTEPDAPLWYQMRRREMHPLRVESLTGIIKRMRREAGIKRSVSIYDLRRTAYNRFPRIDRERIKAGFGWTPGSMMPEKVYSKLTASDLLRPLIKTDDEIQGNVCPNCNKANPSGKAFCVWCSTPLVEQPVGKVVNQFYADKKAQEELEELRNKMSRLEKMFSAMTQEPDFEKFLEKIAKKS